jgi:hypothetical protein
MYGGMELSHDDKSPFYPPAQPSGPAARPGSHDVVFAIWPMIDGQFSRDDGQLNSVIVIVMTVLPATLVYLIFQCYFVSGLTSGAVKG